MLIHNYMTLTIRARFTNQFSELLCFQDIFWVIPESDVECLSVIQDGHHDSALLLQWSWTHPPADIHPTELLWTEMSNDYDVITGLGGVRGYLQQDATYNKHNQKIRHRDLLLSSPVSSGIFTATCLYFEDLDYKDKIE